MDAPQNYFMEDRARSLAFEAVHFPSTAPAALAWIARARRWADAHGDLELSDSMHMAERAIYGGVRPGIVTSAKIQ